MMMRMMMAIDDDDDTFRKTLSMTAGVLALQLSSQLMMMVTIDDD